MAKWEFAHVEWSEGVPGAVTYFYRPDGGHINAYKNQKMRPNDVMISSLTRLGEEGWELTSVTTYADLGVTGSVFYFKRQIG
jgi:hypothetical protein